jgi:hypothetical protein
MSNMPTQDTSLWDDTGTYSAGINSAGEISVTDASILTAINNLITVMTVSIDGGNASSVYGPGDILNGGGAS